MFVKNICIGINKEGKEILSKTVRYSSEIKILNNIKIF